MPPKRNNHEDPAPSKRRKDTSQATAPSRTSKRQNGEAPEVDVTTDTASKASNTAAERRRGAETDEAKARANRIQRDRTLRLNDYYAKLPREQHEETTESPPSFQIEQATIQELFARLEAEINRNEPFRRERDEALQRSANNDQELQRLRREIDFLRQQNDRLRAGEHVNDEDQDDTDDDAQEDLEEVIDRVKKQMGKAISWDTNAQRLTKRLVSAISDEKTKEILQQFLDAHKVGRTEAQQDREKMQRNFDSVLQHLCEDKKHLVDQLRAFPAQKLHLHENFEIVGTRAADPEPEHENDNIHNAWRDSWRMKLEKDPEAASRAINRWMAGKVPNVHPKLLRFSEMNADLVAMGKPPLSSAEWADAKGEYLHAQDYELSTHFRGNAALDKKCPRTVREEPPAELPDPEWLNKLLKAESIERRSSDSSSDSLPDSSGARSDYGAWDDDSNDGDNGGGGSSNKSVTTNISADMDLDSAAASNIDATDGPLPGLEGKQSAADPAGVNDASEKVKLAEMSNEDALHEGPTLPSHSEHANADPPVPPEREDEEERGKDDSEISSDIEPSKFYDNMLNQ
jgi:hypothetical protein